jgi:hypothetical protein
VTKVPGVMPSNCEKVCGRRFTDPTLTRFNTSLFLPVSQLLLRPQIPSLCLADRAFFVCLL